jgi:Na+-transporting methylmalonyl-CoA/oxaloacetate decarboxylase gamma subunit
MNGVDWSYALQVFMVGFSGVFSCLIILMFCVKGMGFLNRLIKTETHDAKKGDKANG